MSQRVDSRWGFTLLEMIIALTLVGVMSAMVYPRVGTALSKQDVRAARDMVTTLHAKARANAVARGIRTALAVSGANCVIVSAHPATGALDTVGTAVDLGQRFGVSVSMSPGTRDSLIFDAREIGSETTSTYVYLSKGAFADTVLIGPLGRILR